MKVLVACEYSGRVRDAFRDKGHDAWSCDLLPCNRGNKFHYVQDVFDVLPARDWDLVIAHPPCTAICVSGNRHYSGSEARKQGVLFVERIWDYPCKMMAIENPVGVLNSVGTKLPKPYYIQPWQHGHGETKKTGLWTRGLPKLLPSNVVEGREARIHRMPPSEDRGKLRSLTYQGIADAMADEWG